jgi:hypothetical protein
MATFANTAPAARNFSYPSLLNATIACSSLAMMLRQLGTTTAPPLTGLSMYANPAMRNHKEQKCFCKVMFPLYAAEGAASCTCMPSSLVYSTPRNAIFQGAIVHT